MLMQITIKYNEHVLCLHVLFDVTVYIWEDGMLFDLSFGWETQLLPQYYPLFICQVSSIDKSFSLFQVNNTCFTCPKCLMPYLNSFFFLLKWLAITISINIQVPFHQGFSPAWGLRSCMMPLRRKQSCMKSLHSRKMSCLSGVHDLQCLYGVKRRDAAYTLLLCVHGVQLTWEVV